MPSGNDPPDPVLTSTLVTTLKAMTYDSGAAAFKSGSTLYWLFVQRVTGTTDRAQWFHATDGEGAENPKFTIPQFTYDVIKNGTYSNGKMSYQGSSYNIRMYRDASAGQIAKAIV